MTAVRSRLEVCVATVAARLTDHEPVIREATACRRWHPMSLSNGPPGIAVLFAELSHQDGSYRRIAHSYLALATRHAAPVGGLQHGLAALAFAATAAARTPRDYATLLDKLNDQLAAHVRRVLRGAPRQGTTFETYDVVSGLTGIGRLLLRQGDQQADVLRDVLSYLVALTEPIRIAGATLPGWWVQHGPTFPPSDVDGHVNFGLAHGIAGPLALLSLAWREGHRVPGQDAAIGRIVEWLLAQRGRHAGPFWPPALFTAEYLGGTAPVQPETGPSWCYGAPGIARAIQLAGLALTEPTWVTAAASVVRELAAMVEGGLRMGEVMLCHGSAGLLQSLWRIESDLGEPALAAAMDMLAGQLLDAYDDSLPFGFRVNRMADSVDLDLPGFLDGAAGIALAISTYLTRRAPATGWDSALLLG